MSEWARRHLGDLLDIKHGYAFEGQYFGDVGRHRLITPGNLAEKGGFVDRGDKQKRYNGPVPRDYVLEPGALIVAMTEQAEGLLGSSAIVPSGDPCLHNQRIGLVCLRRDDAADKRFLYYLFNTKVVRDQIRASASGVKVRHTSPGRIKAVSVCLPVKATQERIASILSAYDDLIEVNRRRVAILEEMARRLFEDWFVHLRYPGNETVPVHETADGPLPEGWQRAVLSTLTSYINRGIAPRYDDTSETLVASQKCVRDGRFSLERARRQSKPVPREKLVRPGDILINSTGAGTLGRVAQVESAVPGLTVDSHVTVVRPKLEQDRDFLGSTLTRLQPEFERLGTGSTNQTELNRSTIAAIPVVIPPSSLRERFGLVVRPARELIAALSEQTIRLAAARDLLLPRLISGELSVAEAPAAERLLEAAD